MAHSGQTAKLQSLHLVSGHGQPVHRAQPLQHGGDVGKVVEGEAQAAKLSQASQLLWQRAQVIAIQGEGL